MVSSVIITCYNHEDFIEKSILSVLDQDANKEVFVVDNGSRDGSLQKIEALKSVYDFSLIAFPNRINYCKAFNTAFKLAKGDYIVDHSGDDIMLPGHLKSCLNRFKVLGDQFGVVFSNGQYVDESGKNLSFHFDMENKQQNIPQGDIYKDLLERYIIAAPTMIIKKEVLDDLGGYDESLAYEDFDFWIRASRNWEFAFSSHLGIQIRKHSHNFGQQFYQRGQNVMLWSTFKVCIKARKLNRDEVENRALHQRCSYHLRQAVFTEHFNLAKKYYSLIRDVSKPNLKDKLMYMLALIQWPVYPFYRMYINNHRA